MPFLYAKGRRNFMASGLNAAYARIKGLSYCGGGGMPGIKLEEI